MSIDDSVAKKTENFFGGKEYQVNCAGFSANDQQVEIANEDGKLGETSPCLDIDPNEVGQAPICDSTLNKDQYMTASMKSKEIRNKKSKLSAGKVNVDEKNENKDKDNKSTARE